MVHGGAAIRRLILWDVDGTLVRAGPVASTAFYDAVESVLGRPATDRTVSMGGKTDPQIALEILAKLAVEGDEARAHLPAVLQALERNLHDALETIRGHGRVMPGVEAALRRLDAEPGVLQSVLSGNLAANARLKVGAFGLDRWLDMDTGAYGSDHEARAELVPIALANVERRRGVRFDPGDVWVIGDTPLDLACARAAGTRCLLVATGREPLERLAPLGADAALADLSDTDAVVRLLLGDAASADDDVTARPAATG